MYTLLSGTTAYKIYSTDADENKLSHAYMLYFSDRFLLKDALKFFALKFFNANINSRDGKLILSEGLSDLKIYPQPDKKLTVADAEDIIADSVLRPIEKGNKLFIISDFETASPIFQNKLLKVLEEPPQGVYFLLGASALSSVLDTIKSRVKMLEISPFTPQQVRSALDRQGVNAQNAQVAQSCGGLLGTALNMLSTGWFQDVYSAAKLICSADDMTKAGNYSAQFADFKYKNELLLQMQAEYFARLQALISSPNTCAPLCKQALIYAGECIPKALADVKFNANFANLLYDFMVRVILENNKWKKSLV